MNSEGTSNNETLETQIVVIGGGGAGLFAALEAAKKGAKVILLEKRRKLGGTSAMAAGFFAAESPTQKRQKIDANRDELFKIAMKTACWEIDPRIVRAFIDKSGDTIRWLEEHGIAYEWFEGAHNVHVLKDLKHPVGGFGAKLKILTEKCREGGVQILLNTSGKKIV